MKTEFEVKFYPVSKNEIVVALKNKGAHLLQSETKTVISAYNRSLNPQIDGNYVRVRDEGDTVRLSIKIHALEGGEVADQKELDVVVSDFEAMNEILSRIGLHRTGYQEKLRETWSLKGAEVVIDTWPGLETYIEIEAASEELVREVAEELGFEWSDRIITSVVEIYMQKYNLSADEVLRLLGDATFANNPFAQLGADIKSSKLVH